MRTMLSLDNVAVGYNSHNPPVLENIGLQVRAGEFVGVIGPNGSGKSTLVRTLSRVLAPLAGTVLLNGQDLYTRVNARQSAQNIGVVPQTASAVLEFSVRDIVEMGRAPYLTPRPFAALSAGDLDMVDGALRAAGIWDMADRLAPTLSGGEWQRVLLARALAQAPDILLLDEPTAHLDLRHQRQVLTLARSLARQNKAVVAVLHDLNLAAEFCDYLVLVHDGQIAAEGTPGDVLTEARLAAIYDTPFLVRRHPLTGRPMILSVPDNPQIFPGTGRSVHVICGMGSGAEIFSRLVRAGWSHITCDVLTEGDPDADTARHFNILFPVVASFTIPTDTNWAEGRRMALSASALIIAPVPFGPLNAPALHNGLAAQASGIPVFCLTGGNFEVEKSRQETIAPLWNSLLEHGAILVPTLPALVATIAPLLSAPDPSLWKP